MKTCFFGIILVAIVGASNAFSQTAQPDSVFQSWNELLVIVPLARSKDSKGKTVNNVTATFSGILRIGRSGPDVVDRRAGVTLDFRVNSHLSLMAGVLQRKDELVKDSPHSETRLGVGATLSTTWHDFSFRDRNMLEHRFRNGRSDTNFYRQRIQVSHPIKFRKNVIFSPFISEEGYYDLGGKDWVQNEFYAGITRTLNQRMSIDIAYLRCDSKPVDVNGLSLSLKITLR